MAIFPVIFSFGFEPTEGTGLLFKVLPAAFGEVPFGVFFLALFLITLLFATLTSSFSIYEVIIAAAISNTKLTRKRATWLIGGTVFIAAIPSALTSSVLKDVSIFGLSIFDATDYLVSNVLLPLSGLLISIFIIHKIDKAIVKEEILLGSSGNVRLYKSWRLFMTWLVPVVISIIFIDSLGIIKIIFG